MVKAKVENYLSLIGIKNPKDYLDVQFQNLNVDSLDVYELCMELENDFDVTIPDEKIAEMKSPNDLIRFVENICEDKNND